MEKMCFLQGWNSTIEIWSNNATKNKFPFNYVAAALLFMVAMIQVQNNDPNKLR